MGAVTTYGSTFTTQATCSHGLYYNMDIGLLEGLIFFVGLIIAITIHEFSHAFVADHFGDPTPRSFGRVTLNPLAHLDPLDTLMLFFVHFGWGKPVPIDPYNLSKREEIYVALAGPLSNMAMAILFALVIRFIPLPIFYIFIQTNIVLAIFNLLPLPPLDGSKILLNLLPEEHSLKWQQAFDSYGVILLALALFLPFQGSNLINIILAPAVKFVLRTLL